MQGLFYFKTKYGLGSNLVHSALNIVLTILHDPPALPRWGREIIC